VENGYYFDEVLINIFTGAGRTVFSGGSFAYDLNRRKVSEKNLVFD